MRASTPLLAGLALCLLECQAGQVEAPALGERGAQQRQADAERKAQQLQADAELKALQKQTDAKLESFMDWALKKGLHGAYLEVNMPLHDYGHDVGSECGEGKPGPEDGLCTGAHGDVTGWRALLHWRFDDPEAASVRFSQKELAPRTCDDLGAAEETQPRVEMDGLWTLRTCRVEGAQVLLSQMTQDDYNRVHIEIISERLIRADPNVARHVENYRTPGP